MIPLFNFPQHFLLYFLFALHSTEQSIEVLGTFIHSDFSLEILIQGRVILFSLLKGPALIDFLFLGRIIPIVLAITFGDLVENLDLQVLGESFEWQVLLIHIEIVLFADNFLGLLESLDGIFEPLLLPVDPAQIEVVELDHAGVAFHQIGLEGIVPGIPEELLDEGNAPVPILALTFLGLHLEQAEHQFVHNVDLRCDEVLQEGLVVGVDETQTHCVVGTSIQVLLLL